MQLAQNNCTDEMSARCSLFIFCLFVNVVKSRTDINLNGAGFDLIQKRINLDHVKLQSTTRASADSLYQKKKLNKIKHFKINKRFHASASSNQASEISRFRTRCKPLPHSRHWFLHTINKSGTFDLSKRIQVKSKSNPFILVSIFVSTDKFLYDRSHGCDRSL